ncbi:hypothetical protein FKM82_024222 [Ascaphus truei]
MHRSLLPLSVAPQPRHTVPRHHADGGPDAQLAQQLPELDFSRYPTAALPPSRLHAEEDAQVMAAPSGGHVEDAGHLQEEEAADVHVGRRLGPQQVQGPDVDVGGGAGAGGLGPS